MNSLCLSRATRISIYSCICVAAECARGQQATYKGEVGAGAGEAELGGSSTTTTMAVGGVGRGWWTSGRTSGRTRMTTAASGPRRCRDWTTARWSSSDAHCSQDAFFSAVDYLWIRTYMTSTAVAFIRREQQESPSVATLR
jgi:hypothetical protein